MEPCRGILGKDIEKLVNHFRGHYIGFEFENRVRILFSFMAPIQVSSVEGTNDTYDTVRQQQSNSFS